MSSPSTDATETTGPWEGGFAGLPDLGNGVVAIASELPEAGTGSLVSYSGGVFEMRFWTDGPPVPQIIEILSPEALKPIRDQLAAQRKADIRSLVRALQAATVNSQWQQVLSFAEQAVLPAEETGKRKVNPTKRVSRQPLFR